MELLEIIRNAGIVGAGGAGFPTHKKLDCKAKIFIANGAECEPLLKTDQYIMQKYSEDIIKGIEIIGDHLGAEKKILAIKKKYRKEIENLKKAIDNLRARVELFYLDSFFPTGDEHVLVYEATGKIVPPGGIPLQVDTIVSNVSTIVNVVRAIDGKPVISKILSMLGEVNRPTLVEVPLGTSVKRCIEEAGGAKIADYCVIMGGPMMGTIINQEELQERVITKTDGSVIVLPPNHNIVNKNRVPIKHIVNQAKSACIQCEICTELCPRFLIGHPLRPHKIMRTVAMNHNEEKILREALTCCECGICELYACPMGLSPRLMNLHLKEELKKKKIKFNANNDSLEPAMMRDFRKIPVNRLISRLNLNLYEGQKLAELKKVSAKRVSIPLKQHIGLQATPIVEVGDVVAAGDIIGKMKEGELGAYIHASIRGKIIEVTDKIVIEDERSGVVEC
ncbi:Na+-translocating ferredoxin:NAD+ oxidoreductase RNF, RnfC subunit [Natronincola peptidivorans]|uniref:Na+-translocating ferredoxin:NAD+ oxidoreductase RNF, RnfC subunit n=1 Tax=Natronincola peptidivorans TaxID=426128 RepID=A0A1I0EXM0_9FIRM|nr:4Fe-4S dicluster domain-containing protein [Natronincola peptidivorans]SET49438.1 Na+-translocating ferredoxin:NAD+ oxidoreductase RNF, RnfC subunit [Natronincola peptidivorans]